MSESISVWVQSNRKLALFSLVSLLYIVLLTIANIASNNTSNRLLAIVQLALALILFGYLLTGFFGGD